MNHENSAKESPEEKPHRKEIQIVSSVLPVEFCRFMLDEIPEGIYAINHEGTLRYANLTLAKILGYERVDDIIGHDYGYFLRKDSRDKILRHFHDDKAAGVEPVFFTVEINSPQKDSLSLEIRPKNTIDVNGETLYSGIVRENSEKPKNDGAFKVTEKFYQSLVDLSPDVISVIYSDGNIAQLNAKAEEIFGPEESLIGGGATIFDIIMPEYHEKARIDIGNVILHGELHDTEYRFKGQDGSLLWGSVSAKLIPGPGDDIKTILVLIRDITKRKTSEENLLNLSVTDDLTGLFNRRGFTLAAEQELKHASRRKEGLALLFFDIDGLKSINDTFGHHEGDNAIREAAIALRATFRESDIVARWGGDEFVVLALDIPKGRVPALLQRLDQMMQLYNQKQVAMYKVSLSMGIAHYDPEAPCSLAELEQLADETMYRNKQDKKR